MKRSREVYEQRFHVRYTEIAIGYPEHAEAHERAGVRRIFCHRNRAGRYDLPA